MTTLKNIKLPKERISLKKKINRIIDRIIFYEATNAQIEKLHNLRKGDIEIGIRRALLVNIGI